MISSSSLIVPVKMSFLSARVEANITANQAAKANVAGTHTGPITFAVGLNDIV